MSSTDNSSKETSTTTSGDKKSETPSKPTSKRDQIDQLLAALTNLEGPSVKINEALFEFHKERKRSISSFEQYEPSERLPSYTESIDAALTLVQDGKTWGVGTIIFDELPPRSMFAANCRRPGYIGPETPSYDALGNTPALALCIAALKARRDET